MIFFFGCEHLYHHYWGLMWSDQKVAGSDPASDVHVSVPTQSHIVAGGLVSTKLLLRLNCVVEMTINFSHETQKSIRMLYDLTGLPSIIRNAVPTEKAQIDNKLQ